MQVVAGAPREHERPLARIGHPRPDLVHQLEGLLAQLEADHLGLSGHQGDALEADQTLDGHGVAPGVCVVSYLLPGAVVNLDDLVARHLARVGDLALKVERPVYRVAELVVSALEGAGQVEGGVGEALSESEQRLA